jgi:hypothetical protein
MLATAYPFRDVIGVELHPGDTSRSHRLSGRARIRVPSHTVSLVPLQPIRRVNPEATNRPHRTVRRRESSRNRYSLLQSKANRALRRTSIVPADLDPPHTYLRRRCGSRRIRGSRRGQFPLPRRPTLGPHRKLKPFASHNRVPGLTAFCESARPRLSSRPSAARTIASATACRLRASTDRRKPLRHRPSRIASNAAPRPPQPLPHPATAPHPATSSPQLRNPPLHIRSLSGLTRAGASCTVLTTDLNLSLRNHRLRRQRPKHQPLQQRIARQPIRPMHPRARRLPRRKQSRQRGPPMHVRPDPAHQIVRRRPHRNQVPRQLQPIPRQKRRNPRKPRLQVHPLPIPHVQIHRPIHPLARDRPRHHIPRRQLQPRMIPLHKPLAARIHQPRALAPQRLAHQKPRRPPSQTPSDGTGRTPYPSAPRPPGTPSQSRRRSPPPDWSCRCTPAPRLRSPAAPPAPAPRCTHPRASSSVAPTTRPSSTIKSTVVVHSINSTSRQPAHMPQQRHRDLPPRRIAMRMQNPRQAMRPLARPHQLAGLAHRAPPSPGRTPSPTPAAPPPASAPAPPAPPPPRDSPAHRPPQSCLQMQRTSSSPPIATAIPPCAYAVFDSASPSFVTTSTSRLRQPEPPRAAPQSPPNHQKSPQPASLQRYHRRRLPFAVSCAPGEGIPLPLASSRRQGILPKGRGGF